MAVIIGSARSDENGKYSGGKAGDQKQTSTDDYKGEVSLQNFYVHKKGWIVLRLIDPAQAVKASAAMMTACNNPNIGYSQSDREGVVKYGTLTRKKVNTDCSALVRCVVKEATGKDPGNFTTANEAAKLTETGLIEKVGEYKAGMTLYTGDMLVTKTKGHTAVVVQGAARPTTKKTNPYKEPASNIKKGSKGEGVKWVQWELNESGASLEVDGIAGTKTDAAIRAFQKKYKLTVDGIAGKTTRAKLKEV